MGGKTKQRVAGNAKPSSSSKARELLFSQQQQSGAGNIITFSVLSGKTKPRHTETDRVTAANTALNAIRSQPQEGLQDLPQTLKDGTKLVVRRVGNRDFYTRVRFSDDDALDVLTRDVAPGVLPSETGVKKPSSSLDRCEEVTEGEIIDSNTASPNRQVSGQQENPEDKPDLIEQNLNTKVDEDLKLNDVLDRFAEAQELVNQSAADCLNRLPQNAVDYELDLLQLCKTLVNQFYIDLSIEDWDCFFRSIYRWTNLVMNSEFPLRETHQTEFVVKVFGFVHQLIMFAEDLKNRPHKLTEESPMVQSIIDDWCSFHSSSLFMDFLSIYFKLISKEICSKDKEQLRPIIEVMAKIIIKVDPKLVLSHHSVLDNLEATIEFDPEFKEPANSIYCQLDSRKYKSFFAVCGLLKSTYRVILVSAHSMLSKFMYQVCRDAATSTLIANQDQGDDAPLFPPPVLMSILTTRDAMMSALLSDYQAGDISVTIEPNTDAYACTLSYLFVWDLLIQFIVGADKEVQHRMIFSFKRLGLWQRLLDNIFMLLPPLGERESLNFRIESNDDDCTTVTQPHQNKLWTISSFLKSPLESTINRPVNEIELVALHLYFSVARHMPVTVRKWYNNNSNKRLCNLVNQYTVKHISQVIRSLEMESVQEQCQERAYNDEFKNLIIKARPSAHEVYTVYTRDEFKLELTIKLPQNYPLDPVQIDGGKRVGVTDIKWRSWLLQLTTFLSHQNGPILDGISLWRKNIDKRFEGVEKCTICFSILHSNYQLPKKKCQTCANMFHNNCLYKWFESSGNSTCPLCRNPW